jgi:hypothetical protein
MCFAGNLINEFQLGFIFDRYIAENAFTTQVLMEADYPEYDRVNIDYLKQVLLQFGFPEPLVQCLYNLLVHNNIRINMNGFFSDQVSKQRGLKQEEGDPISCVLYNIFFEPFLRSILQGQHFHCYELPAERISL